MILLTIGTQLPFDRLVKAVDDIALSINDEIYGQIGAGKYEPRNFEFCRTMKPADFDKQFQRARVIVSHAGIGSILTARKFGKPIVIFPRRAVHGEHRNDHQLATCDHLKDRSGIYVAVDDGELEYQLSREDIGNAMDSTDDKIETRASLIQSLERFIHSAG